MAANENDKKPPPPPVKECSTRIDELAKPRKFLVLGTWQCYGYLFDPQRMQAVKERVQELFSMTPEETELYFNSLRQNKPKRMDMKTLRRKIQQEKAMCKRESSLIFHKLLRKSMKYAFKHAPPLLMTPMLRIISDHVLELLAELHRIDVPRRTDCSNIARFLICLADWTAIFVSNIYYNVELEERTDAQRVRMLDRIKSKSTTVVETPSKEAIEKVTEYNEAAAIEAEAEDLGAVAEE